MKKHIENENKPYIILIGCGNTYAQQISNLESVINEHIEMGYALYGNIIVYRESFSQVMIKKDEVDTVI